MPKHKFCSCGCGEVIQYPKIGKKWIDKSHYIHWLQTSEAGQKHVVKAARKAIQDKEKSQRKKDKEVKEGLKSRSDWENDLQKLVNKIARLIDYGQPCVATGNYDGKKNGGHYISVGANKTIRFNLHNIHIQSEHSNNHKGGDTLRYREGIKNNYSRDYLDFMDGLQAIEKIGWSIEDLKRSISVCNKIIKHLEKDLVVNSAPQRILLRNKFNSEIGIYSEKYCTFIL